MCIKVQKEIKYGTRVPGGTGTNTNTTTNGKNKAEIEIQK
jgi:hypothetical protein